MSKDYQAVKGNDQGEKENNVMVGDRLRQESQPTELSGDESEYEAAEARVEKFMQGYIKGQSVRAREWCPMFEQFCKDLNSAHDELLRAQGVAEADLGKYDWPEWSPQANSIRWAEGLLKVKLAKTDQWTLYPSANTQDTNTRGSASGTAQTIE